MARIGNGRHVAVARAWEFGEASTGKAQVGVEFEILEGEDAGEFITWYGFFTDDTEQRTLEALRYAGWQGDDLLDLKGMGTRRVVLIVEEESYQGKTHSRVRWVNRFGGNGVRMAKAMAEQDRRMLAARLRSVAASIGVLPPDKELPAPTPIAAGSPPRAAAPATSRSSAPASSGGWGQGERPAGEDRFREEAPPRSDDDLPF